MSRLASAAWPLRALYVLLIAVLAGSLLAALALGVALAGLHRLSFDLDPAGVPTWFWYYRADPLVRRWLGVGLLSAVSLGLLVLLAALGGLRPPLHGAARWATEADLRRAGLRAPTGVLLGRKAGRFLVSGGEEHVMLYAPTRSGKGVSVVIPNLLNWPDSAVVLDVKRENWEASAGYRQAHGQEVFLFDPLAPDGRTARYNPLGHIDRGDPVAVMDELQKLAAMLFPAQAFADPFWSEAARTGFIGVGAYVAQSSQTFSLGVIYGELTHSEARTRLRHAVEDQIRAGKPLSPDCARALSDFCSTSDATFASIKQTITARLNLFLNPRVCAATEVSDFDLRALRDRRISIYLGVSPDNLTRIAPLYNLFFSQLIDLSTRERPSGERHRIKVLVVLDEFARLGHAEVIARGFSYVAGYGLRLLPVLQSPAQLRAEYGPDLAQDITSNCGVEIAFGFKELRVAQDLSERLGFYTYAGRSRSRPAGLARGHRSMTESDQRRALMLPQELMQLPPHQLLVLRANMPPVRGTKITYWREPVFRRRITPAPVPPIHPGVANRGAGPPPAPPPGPSAPDRYADLRLTPLAHTDLQPLRPGEVTAEALRRWTEAVMRQGRSERDQADRGPSSKT